MTKYLLNLADVEVKMVTVVNIIIAEHRHVSIVILNVLPCKHLFKSCLTDPLV